MRPLLTSGAGADPAAERFVLDAVHAFATGAPCPPAPADDTWLSVAEAAGVAATIGAALSAAGTVEPRLIPARLGAAAVSMRTGLELRATHTALDGLRWAVLKGPILADVVYSAPNARSYDDLDVLVHPGDLPAALDRLAAHGFHLIDRNWPMIQEMRRGEISLLGPNGMALDLHWHLINDPALREQLPIDVAAMLRAVEPAQLGPLTVPRLAPADTVVHVAVHAALSGGHRLKWLLDLQQSVRWSKLDADAIGWRSRVHCVSPLVRVMLDRVSDHIDADMAGVADAVHARTAWTQFCRRVSQAEPPLGETPGRHSGRSVFAATRRTSAASVQGLGAALVGDLRDRRANRGASDEVQRLHSTVDSPLDREQWLTYAAAQMP